MFLCSLHASDGLAANEFKAEENLKFTLPKSDAPTTSVSFTVYSTEGTNTGVAAQVSEVKGPNGLPLPAGAVTASVTPSVPAEGAALTLVINNSQFLDAGDYRVSVFIRGKGKAGAPVSALLTPVVTLPGAQLNLAEMEGVTFRVTRSVPGSTASGSFPFSLFETTGRAPIRDVSVEGGGVFEKSAKAHVPGEVNVKDAKAGSGGEVTMTLELKGLQQAGTFTSILKVSSPGLDGVKSVPINIEVTDAWYFPLLIIFFGVLGGFVANYVADDWRPRQINRYQRVRLKDAVRRQLRLTREPTKLQKLYALLDSVNEAEAKDGQGDAAGAKSLLEQTDKDLKEFRRDEAKAKSDAYSGLNVLKAKVKFYLRELAQPSDEEKAQLALVQSRLDEGEVEECLAEDRVDEALDLFSEIQSDFDAVKRRRLENDLKSLWQQQQRPVEVQWRSEQARVGTLLTEAERLLAKGDLDAARRVSEQADAALKVLAANQPKMARESKPGLPRKPLPTVGEEEAARELTHVEVRTPPGRRMTNRPVRFVLADGEGLLRPGEKLLWDFDDGERRGHGASITHAFKQAGDYEVSAEIVREGGEGEAARFERPVTILPGRAETEGERILSWLRKGDLFVSLLALLIAVVTGLLYLYVGKVFGTLQDYLLALLWGFGVDNSVRGFAGVLKKVSAREG